MTPAGLLLLTIVIVACLTAAATAVRSVSRIWLRHWVERRLRGAATAELYLERPQRLLLAATTGVAMTVFLAGTFIGTSVAGPLPRARAIVLYALALLLAGQLVPRAVARRWSALLIPVLLPLLRLVEFAFLPVLALARRLTGETRREDATEEPSESEALEELLREGEMEGVGEHTEIAIIEGVVQFGSKTLGQVMTPRSEVFALDARTGAAEVARRAAQSGYSRVPIYRDSLDDVLGMLHAFDLLQMEDDELPRLRPVAVATTSMPANDFLFRMIRERRHLAVVRDEAGRLAGIVTLEDLLEELVGDIRDEHDDPAVALPADSTAAAVPLPTDLPPDRA
jgi:putative hemolysin